MKISKLRQCVASHRNSGLRCALLGAMLILAAAPGGLALAQPNAAPVPRLSPKLEKEFRNVARIGQK